MTKGKQVTEPLMRKVRFTGHVSRQGDKRRIIIIPSKLHDEVDLFDEDDLIIELYRAFPEDEAHDELHKNNFISHTDRDKEKEKQSNK